MSMCSAVICCAVSLQRRIALSMTRRVLKFVCETVLENAMWVCSHCYRSSKPMTASTSSVGGIAQKLPASKAGSSFA
jgi:hypothetical protein